MKNGKRLLSSVLCAAMLAAAAPTTIFSRGINGISDDFELQQVGETPDEWTVNTNSDSAYARVCELPKEREYRGNKGLTIADYTDKYTTYVKMPLNPTTNTNPANKTTLSFDYRINSFGENGGHYIGFSKAHHNDRTLNIGVVPDGTGNGKFVYYGKVGDGTAGWYDVDISDRVEPHRWYTIKIVPNIKSHSLYIDGVKKAEVPSYSGNVESIQTLVLHTSPDAAGVGDSFTVDNLVVSHTGNGGMNYSESFDKTADNALPEGWVNV